MRAENHTASKLDRRAQRLLKALVELYVHQGQPVGSRTLSKGSGLSLSPATVRNVMADLEDLGLINAPHISAGRVPTELGYRFFVDSLLATRQPEPAQVNNMRHELQPELSSKTLIEKASALLTGITNLAGIVSVPPPDKAGLRHIEFIPLNNRRVLVVVVAGDDEVQNKIIHIDRDYAQTELTEFANYLNSRLRGRGLAEVRDEIIQEMKAARDRADDMMLEAIKIAEQALQPQTHGDYVLSGETKLMELASLHKLKHLFEAFHQKQEILKLLDRCAKAEGIQIFIGNESGYESLAEWSVVAAPYAIDGEHIGVLGVIGPTRMAYDRVIPIVDLTAKILGSALASG